VLNALFAAWWAAEDQKWEPQKEMEHGGNRSPGQLELRILAKSLKTSPSAIRSVVGFAPGVISGGLLGPLRGRPLVKDTLCCRSYF
jgi:hypothetical protein